MRYGFGFLAFSFFLTFTTIVSAQPLTRDEQIKQDLKEFENNPSVFLNKLPQKFDRNGKPAASPIPFDRDSIAGNKFLDKKDEVRQHIMISSRKALEGPYSSIDNPSRLVDETFLTVSTLDGMESTHLTSASLKNSPWSSDYWATYKGGLGARYADSSFPSSYDWKTNFDYIDQHPAAAIVASGNQSAIDQLSPSEKYSLITGDTKDILTSQSWAGGQSVYERAGTVEGWFGICHGWSPASFMLKRPAHAITLPATNGSTNILFYPSDIKALASLLWANAYTSTKFIGGRCNDKNPPKDENGRVTSEACFDNNPASWHVAVVNQIGVAKRSFIMDAAYDYQVWNQPVLGYKFTYFNPKTMDTTTELEKATIEKEGFNSDKFAKYRGEKTKYIVGVAMDLNYVVETAASQNLTDSETEDATNTVRYLYDLELDADKNIIGGEWYSNFHPDFLWVPNRDSEANSAYEDEATGEWDGHGPLPESWKKAAGLSAEQFMPLRKIIEEMIEKAQ